MIPAKGSTVQACADVAEFASAIVKVFIDGEN
jgi:hypothetical protein